MKFLILLLLFLFTSCSLTASLIAKSAYVYCGNSKYIEKCLEAQLGKSVKIISVEQQESDRNVYLVKFINYEQ
jgi:hypothetical protein